MRRTLNFHGESQRHLERTIGSRKSFILLEQDSPPTVEVWKTGFASGEILFLDCASENGVVENHITVILTPELCNFYRKDTLLGTLTWSDLVLVNSSLIEASYEASLAIPIWCRRRQTQPTPYPV
ncbi:unnamed protein product [Nippostrongylus brasiliensis]|uniref:DUF2442 domain-containing protein n=1 Tax=Nippostrongylus brasiliensis TaxID=27835 RepID=A0A0N4YDY0_NIPBR|nr:unnamed protein product [Nippostrongylus brasiliensis]